MVHLKSLSGQQNAKAAMPKLAAFVRQLPQPYAQGLVTRILFPALER
ncbi:hypothetical protein IWQ55_006627 [Labrenzia sp. EL_208]|nr:hypothetical protein [Labrenzia sp. EL_132]MBG6233385.1 hypothetical protein [Labrenzia sp. EL_208]